MKISIMQPYFFPYLGYFQLIHAVDKFILYKRVNFIKEAWMNRNFILNAGNGSKMQIACQLKNKSSYSLINEVRLHEKNSFAKKLLKTLYLNYRKSPYFNNVFPLIEYIFSNQYDYLYEFNNNSIIEIARYLMIKTIISTDENYFDELEVQLAEREKHFPQYDKNNYPVKLLRVFEICRKEGANIFYNAIGGSKLYNKERFRQANIELGFIEAKPVFYPQYNHSFVPDLSIIDVMMFNPVERFSEMLSGYDII
jgi:hypothetical protein